MSIVRHEIRQIKDENRGQPIISQAVVHGKVAYLAGVTANPRNAIQRRDARPSRPFRVWGGRVLIVCLTRPLSGRGEHREPRSAVAGGYGPHRSPSLAIRRPHPKATRAQRRATRP
jgi:hypothetical protein